MRALYSGMLLALVPIDLGILLLYLGAMLAVGGYFRPGNRSPGELWLGGRDLARYPLGIATLFAVFSGAAFAEVPGNAYHAGVRGLLVLLPLWLTIPLVQAYVLPAYFRGQYGSVYEYVAVRFHPAMGRLTSFYAFIWRWLWLVVLGTLLVRWFSFPEVESFPVWLWGLAGTVTTAAAVWGGMRGLVWSDVCRLGCIAAALGLLLAAIGWHVEGGFSRIWEVAEGFGRTAWIPASRSGESGWHLAEHLIGSGFFLLGLGIADQMTVQRYLAARTLADAQQSLLWHGLFLTAAMGGVVAIGVGLLAFYHEHPEAMRIKWVVNVDGETRRSLTAADRARFEGESLSTTDPRPLLDWDDPRDDVTATSLERLVRERRILHPNRKTPWEDASELRGVADPQRLIVEQLATRRPPPPGWRQGEVVLNRRAAPELLPWFLFTQLPFGISGVVAVGVLAAAMATFHAGIHALATLIEVDGMGATRDEAADPRRSLRRGRWVVGGIGVVTMAAAGLLTRSTGAEELLLALPSLLGPLLGVFGLGLLTQRGNARGAAVGFAVGGLLAIAFPLIAATYLPASGPAGWPRGVGWPLVITTLVTGGLGYLVSLTGGDDKRGRVTFSGSPFPPATAGSKKKPDPAAR